ncbi:MAG TPA: CHASE domain-containing protein [Thermoanaerobaculia bacterium]|nr:CHASE domain-containing protein [Thermoanaerobaculia bacterium]
MKRRWLQIVVLAAAYGFAGWLGRQLAIPPGYATAVWPASGIALAGVLLGGRRVWPGVLLGSFCVNFLAAVEPSAPAGMIIRAAVVATLLGAWASLQAVAGAELVRRSTGGAAPLMDDQRHVLRLLFWGGPVACLISTTLGVLTLLLWHIITPRDVLFHWATWWVGDTLGALIFAPLILLWTGPYRTWRRWLSVSLPLLATFCLSVFLFFYASRREGDALRTAFEDRARTLTSAVRASCDNHLEVLVSLDSLFASSQEVTAQEFRRFVATALQRHPGIRGLSWNQRLTAAERPRFEAETGMRVTEINAQKRRVPAGPRKEYVVVRYVEPAADLSALGLNIASEPVRREALGQARDTGEIAATGPIVLVSEQGERRSVLLFAPFYGIGNLPTTIEQRRRELRGYATGAFRLEDLVERAIENLPREGLTIALFDSQRTKESGLLYADGRWSDRGQGAGDPVWREGFVYGQRPWEIRVAATLSSLDSHRSWSSWLILICGFLFTGLLGAFLLVVSSRTAKVEKLVVRRTAELQNELQERRRAEGVVRLSEARNRALLEHMIGGMITFDEESRIESVNPAAEKMLGYREDELIGQSVALLIADAPANAQEAYLRKAHQTAIGRLTEWRSRRKNGETFSSEAALFEFEVPEGRRFACNFQDISERREVDRLKSEFVSTVSHELRTPLTSIRGSLGLLAAGVLGDLSPRVRDIVSLAERNAVRLTALINDILDFERLESGRVEMQMEDVGLQSLFEQSLDAVRPMSDERRITLVCGTTGLRLRADATRIVQVLVNLLSNAIKFSPSGREIRVWAEQKDGVWVRVLVEDRGMGIPEIYHQRIFERFAQVETSDKRDQGGTGLGLAICKAIVEHHGGRIGVDSIPGEGSTFWFDLPQASA